MIKIGLIGAGFMGGTHAASYEQLLHKFDAKLTAVADLDIKKAEQVAVKFGAKTFKTAQELLDNADVNTIDICLPTYLHAKYAVAAMEKGYNTFVEKPLGLTADEADQIEQASKANNVKTMVGQCIRMWDEYVYLKKVVDDGTYGKIKTGVFKRVSPKPDWAWENWLHIPEKSGCVAIDFHIHDIDFVRYILGEPDTINSKAYGHEHIFTTYTYGDTIISIEGGWGYPANMPFEMEYRVEFEKATVHFSSLHGLKVYTMAGEQFVPEIGIEYQGESEELDGNISSLGAYYNELNYFLKCIRDDKPVEIAPISEGVKSLKLALKGAELAK